MNYGIVYAYVNRHNMKIYIGQTTQPIYRRRREHWGDAFRKNHSRPFCRALRKYGKEAFEEIILAKCSSKEELDAAERHAIAFFDATNKEKGYNLTSGGQLSCKHTSEAIEKIRQASIRMHSDPERRHQASLLGKANYWALQTKESGIKRSAAQRGKKINEAQKNGLALGKIACRRTVIGTNLVDGSVKEFSSIREAEKETGVSHQQIWGCCNNRCRATGWEWRYKNGC